MVVLKNIIKNNDYLECDIFPEDSKLPGHIVISDEEIIAYSLPDGYEYCLNHVRHAFKRLKEEINKNQFDNSISVIWC